KDGKEHRTWSIVENRRVRGGRVVQRHVLYLGEINRSQREAWRKSIEIFEEGSPRPRTASLFPEQDAPEISDESIIRIKLKALSLQRPRQWGACWLACELYEQLGLDQFWAERLPASREGTRWDQVLQTVVTYRLLDPGSEWRLHREWFLKSAMADLLGSDFSLAEIHKLYEVHDKLLVHKEALFAHLQERWKDLFGVRFEVLLYDLTSTYFESDPPESASDKRRFGYSRDQRPDCVQVVIALVVTPEGFPLAYEVMPGNTADNTTLPAFLDKIERLYGKAERIWLMDRGIPTEEVLQPMRESDPPICYLVGTPKGRLTQLEKDLADRSWEQVREGVEVKLLP
ncbi:MAG TPA: IS1634 family transposase, partial [Pseudodesulfovibrio sp.]|nr:IS1634 family transposase [Pseudodesulfovibrio sp.]